MINKLLSTAIKFYLRSQVTKAEDLQVKIVGKNRQILQGYIPQVLLCCNRAVYQGLFLRQIEIHGININFNLPEVLKKKPFKLLEPIIVDIKLGLDAADLQASLDSPLLQSGLSDLWQIILAAQLTDARTEKIVDSVIEWHSIAIASETLNLRGTYQDTTGKVREINLSTGIGLTNDHTLDLSPLKITSESVSSELGEQLEIELGTDVAIEQLVIESEQMLCSGKITINS
ncbi:DUF2993 domain-containing protein [Pleurocapsa sp. PCC 7319]|uniref:LmeA family phospholipid-binding protein n=1 Tax=Pleurocapsa sp. PCC 7319 TaxID=118161 RepID=UPI00034D4430|nr:DUF2993 domain-containing protein [Pleurocapsa sp. PCC 7319]